MTFCAFDSTRHELTQAAQYAPLGHTVNLASRMESTGVPGQIQVTRSVYERLKDGFEFESRGAILVKGKGEIETWLLHGQLKPAEMSA